jgi:methylmalonyl-CoA/ethylmalonyl-CoA epimerase
MERFLFHHVGVEVRDLQTAIPVFKDLFGYDLISGPFDDPIQGVSVCFLRRGEGDPVLELVAPLGSNSPILCSQVRRGHLPYLRQGSRHQGCDQSSSRKESFLMSGPVSAVAFEMKEIAWLMTEKSPAIRRRLLNGSRPITRHRLVRQMRKLICLLRICRDSNQ